jgi:membrane-bound metal-dependent hydrolase YbcI (DUF457 family)
MSWAAHDFECYVLQRHLGKRVSFLGILAGTYVPDAFTKWYVYGVNLFGVRIGAADPPQFHRGWPGAGFTHSLAFGVVLALAVLLVSRSRPWALGMLIGVWAQSITDICDSAGTMLFFPFSTENISIGMWAYAAQIGRYDDAGAYYSSLGLVMDAGWGLLALWHWRILKKEYFRTVVAPSDPLWSWLGRRFPEVALVAFYRAGFFYGATRFIAWMIWAHVTHDYAFDLSWGGPDWVEEVRL